MKATGNSSPRYQLPPDRVTRLPVFPVLNQVHFAVAQVFPAYVVHHCQIQFRHRNWRVRNAAGHSLGYFIIFLASINAGRTKRVKCREKVRMRVNIVITLLPFRISDWLPLAFANAKIHSPNAGGDTQTRLLLSILPAVPQIDIIELPKNDAFSA